MAKTTKIKHTDIWSLQKRMPKRPPSELWCKPGAHNTSKLYHCMSRGIKPSGDRAKLCLHSAFHVEYGLKPHEALWFKHSKAKLKIEAVFFHTKVVFVAIVLVFYLLWELEDTVRYQYQQDFVRARSCASPLHVMMETFPPSLYWPVQFSWAGMATNKLDSVEVAHGWVDVPPYWSTLYSSVLLSMVENQCVINQCVI